MGPVAVRFQFMQRFRMPLFEKLAKFRGYLAVRGSFRVRVNRIAGPTGRELHFGMKITQGTVLSWFQFSKSLFRDVSGTVPESFRICGFKRNSSNIDRAPKMRDSIPLNSWDSFSVNLPSFSSETCVTYYSIIPETNVFCDWLFLDYSCVCLEPAANFFFVS